MAQAYERGERVFLASGGMGIVVDFAQRGPDGRPAPWRPEAGPPAFYIVSADQVVACVPVERAGETLRPLVSRETAQAMLDVLRGPEPEPDLSVPLLERGKQVVHSGSPLDHARLLRELYALPVPLSEALASGLAFLQRLVLPEIAEVLGVPREDLEAEMRRRYPAAEPPGGFRIGG